MIVKYYMVLWGTQPCVDVEDYGYRLHMAGAVPKVYSLACSWFPFRDLMPLGTRGLRGETGVSVPVCGASAACSSRIQPTSRLSLQPHKRTTSNRAAVLSIVSNRNRKFVKGGENENFGWTRGVCIAV